MHKCRVAVLFGGVSSEHEVSRVSARSVIDNIPKDEYEVFPVGISKCGEWFLFHGDTALLPDGSWEHDPGNERAFLPPDAKIRGLVSLDGRGGYRVHPIDAVFPVLHGANGEDGTVQGLLTLSKIPFVGCGTAASAVCMDKVVTKMILGAGGIPQAKWDAVLLRDFHKDPEGCLDRFEARLGSPVFVKPANAGSSVGITKTAGREALRAAVELAGKYDPKIVLEEAVRGTEVECAVLGNDDPEVSVCGEIVPANEFYDYEAKYHSAASELHIPARIPQQKAEEVRAMARRAYRLLGCAGMTRMDFFIRASDGAVLLNEPNTIPGFTSISMYPKLFEASGLPYGRLLDRLIRLAIER